MNTRPAAPLTAAIAFSAVLLACLTGCDPHAGDSCDPNKDSSYFSSHTDNGKTTTVRLECHQVGPDQYQWVKV